MIDCSHINFRIPPTGIPRVVTNYVNQGYRWAASAGIEVTPVVPTAIGVFAAGLVAAIRHPAQSRNTGIPAREMIHAIGHQFRTWARRALYRVDALLPASSKSSFIFLLDARISQWATRLVRSFKLSEPSKRRIEPKAGDVLFCPSFWHEVDPEIYLRLRAQGCAVVLLVHDILPITHPDCYPFPWRDQFKERLIAAFGYATAFLCVSEATRRSLSDFALAQNKRGDFQVAYNGYQPLVGDFGPAGTKVRPDLHRVFDRPTRPFLMVGSIEPKKDYLRIIEYFEERWNDGYRRPLVIVGQPGWLSDRIIHRICHSRQLGRMLFWFHDLDDSSLSHAYTRCHALIFASIAEGFGLPLIEAAMNRKPTIVYSSDAAKEIMGDFAVFFDRTAASLLRAIDAVEEPAAYQALCDRLRTFSWPGWDERAQDVFARLEGFGDSNRALGSDRE